MVKLRLLEEARAAGLTVYADGTTLKVHGPKAAAGLAKALLRDKATILAALTLEPPELWATIGQVETWLGHFRPLSGGGTKTPTGSCSSCFNPRWVRCRSGDSGRPWICTGCHPPQADDESALEFHIVPDEKECGRG